MFRAEKIIPRQAVPTFHRRSDHTAIVARMGRSAIRGYNADDSTQLRFPPCCRANIRAD